MLIIRENNSLYRDLNVVTVTQGQEAVLYFKLLRYMFFNLNLNPPWRPISISFSGLSVSTLVETMAMNHPLLATAWVWLTIVTYMSDLLFAFVCGMMICEVIQR